MFAGEKKIAKICVLVLSWHLFSQYSSPVLGFTQSLSVSLLSSTEGFMCWTEQNIAVLGSINLLVFSWTTRSIAIVEWEDSLYTSIPFSHPRENVGMWHSCILPSPPVWSVFNICKIPKMFAQRILLFPVLMFIRKKSPVDWNLEWKVKWM